MPSTNKTVRKVRKPTPKRRGKPGYRPQLDHDKNGENGGSLPKEEREAAPAAPAPEPEPKDEGTKAEQPSEPAASGEAPEDAAVEPVGVETVRIGAVEGRLNRVPIGAVLSLLGEDAQAHVDHLRSKPATLELQERFRATEGRCAPIVVTQIGDEPPVFFHGFLQLAAARNLGLEVVPVVIIAPGDTGAVQSQLAHQLISKPEEPDDDLIWRVTAHDQDVEEPRR